ncbi:MAG: hypothetical protein JW881_08645 [Spirochaetales bacterium]|nr:hypothetical protein [Spirochaetales bacterium]
MSDKKLDFSLPETKQKNSAAQLVMLILLAGILVVGTLNLVFVFFPPAGGKAADASNRLSAGKQKELALKLQKRGLHEAAAAAWEDYLAKAAIPDPERASIWYTIGKIRQEAGDYEGALTGYYMSEAVFQVEELIPEIGRRVQECIEALGKFAALRRELSERVGMEESVSGDHVVAEIGPEKITKADLDGKIEQYVGLLISQYAAFMEPDALNKQKEELFKQFSGKDGRERMLNQYIIEEILYRKAREEQLAEKPEVRSLLKQTEKQLLAQQLLAKRIAERINITESDLKSYYEGNKGKYIQDGKQKNYEEVKSEVYRDLRGDKEREVQENFLEELRQQYNVVVYPSRLTGETGGEDRE